MMLVPSMTRLSRTFLAVIMNPRYGVVFIITVDIHPCV